MLKTVLQTLLQFISSQRSWDVYTDGSHKGRWGSWAFVVVKNGRIVHEASGRVKKTNCLRMEFQAALEALRYFKPGSKINLYSDSRILVDCARFMGPQPQANSDQVELLHQLNSVHYVTWNWVKGHHGIEFNERCDHLCLLARQET